MSANPLSSNTRVLVTGGAGFIGSNMVESLIKTGEAKVAVYDKLTYAGRLENLANVRSSDRFQFFHNDILDGPAFLGALETFRPNVIYHLAAESHVDRSIDDSTRFVRTNVEGTQSVLNATLQYFGTLSGQERSDFRFVHVSTDEVFGALGKTGAFDESSPYNPNSPYAASKAASDMIARAFQRTYGLPVVVTNCSNNYGPRQFPEKLIPLCLTRALAGHFLPVYGKGEQVRDWLYVDDHVEALYAVAQYGKVGENYCIGGGQELSNLDLVTLLCELLDRKKTRVDKSLYFDLVRFVEDRPGHDYRYAINMNKIEKQCHWRPKFAFSKAMENTVDWYLSNEEWLASISDTSATDRRGLSGK